MKNRWYFFVVAINIAFIVFQVSCNDVSDKKSDNSSDLFYLNHHDTVKYVGMQTCRSCHNDKHATFIHTGMGLSFEKASRSKSSASFGHGAVYDKYRDFYYKPFWENDSMMIMEFRLKGKDTVFKRVEHISYIIGSGQHTNSHMVDFNGYVFQAPLTWYAQKGIWDLPPGFENGSNTRFARLIGLECMSCHNALPDFDNGSVNRFVSIPGGIDCERCHGPGELHVQEKLKGVIVDTSREIDRTIVNPKKLSWELQVDLCQRCHLQGNAVLKEGKDFTMFRPGMRLSDFWDVYMPMYADDNAAFIMAAHAQRFQRSKCFTASNAGRDSKDLRFTCITCHNPHVSVTVTGKQVFNNACLSCHKQEHCTEDNVKLLKEEYNCIHCHMPKSGTEDIPHVTVHDHFIRKPSGSPVQDRSTTSFKGLYPVNNPKADNLSRARAYLQWFDKFGNYEKRFLDSGKYYLEKSGTAVKEWIYYYHLTGNRDAVIQKSTALKGAEKKDAWTAYYVGAAYKFKGNFSDAVTFYKIACDALPAHLDFKVEYASALFLSDRQKEAEALLKEVLGKNPKHISALSNLSVVYLNSGETYLAEKYCDAALALDPDEKNALICKAQLYKLDKNIPAAKSVLERVLKLDPSDDKVKAELKLLSGK